MTHIDPLLVLGGAGAAALVGVAACAVWRDEEARRIRRALRSVLRGKPDGVVVAHGSGRGAGFTVSRNSLAVTWDRGGWCLLYRFDELSGAELIVDGAVARRVLRTEPRPPTDGGGHAGRQVTLRLIFDDPRHAEFMLELRTAARPSRRRALEAADAVDESNHWLDYLEILFHGVRAPRAPVHSVRAPAAPQVSRRQSLPATKPTTDGRLVYAVGDIHGRHDLLDRLIQDIQTDAQATGSHDRPLLIFLGDYVDRGPQARAVIDLILQLRSDGFFEVAPLKGNHEDLLLQFLNDPAVTEKWLAFGGAATLASYGVTPPRPNAKLETLKTAQAAFELALPRSHRDFLESLRSQLVVGDYAFVHAGVRPGVALENQTEHDLLWIRNAFLEAGGPFDKVVVHGHTPMDAAELLEHRIGLDTGAYATGVLSAVRLHMDEQRLLQARNPRDN